MSGSWLVVSCSVALGALLAAACSSPSPSNAADSSAAGDTSASGGFVNVAGAQSSAGSSARGGSEATSQGGGSQAGAPDASSDQQPGATIHVTSAASPGCGSAASAPADGVHTLQVNGEMRSYVLHVPPTYDDQKPFPLVMAFHGKGDLAVNLDGENFKFQTAGGAANVLIYPQALPDPNLQNATSFERDPVDDLAFIDALLASLKPSVCFDMARVFALGHSLGSTFVQTLACERGDQIRAIADQAGDLGMTTGCKGPVAAWVGYGLLDSPGEVSASKMRRDYWLSSNQCDLTSQSPGDPTPPCLDYACAAGYPVEWCEDPSGTHKWSPWMSQSIFDFFAAFVSP